MNKCPVGTENEFAYIYDVFLHYEETCCWYGTGRK